MIASWKTLKRSIAMVMTFVMLFSCVQMGIPTHIRAVETESKNPGISLGDIIAGNYELSEVEEEVLKSGDLSADVTFHYVLPADETNEDDGLVSVDRENKKVSVKNYVDEEKNTWTPKAVTIEVNGEVKETVTLTDGKGTYTFDGGAFAVVVEYVLTAGGLKNSITELQQLALMNAVIYLSEDVDYMQMLDKDVFSSMSAGTMSVDLTVTGFLDMMTIKNDLLGGDSPINLLYSLVAGVEETINLPGEEPEVISIKLTGDAKAAAESLKAQQDKDGKLALSLFLENHDCSYLELLFNDSYRAGLESAIDQNLQDIDDLLDRRGGLPAISSQMNTLRNDTIPMLEETVYELINDFYPDLRDLLGPIPGVSGRDIDSLDEVKAIQAAVDKFYADSLKDANDLLNDKVTSGELNAEWVPENGIQSAADLKALMDNVQKTYDDGIAEINKLLASYGEQMDINLPTVKEAKDIDAVKDAIDEYIVSNLNTLNKTVEQYNDAYSLNLPKVSYNGLDSLEETAEDVQELRTALQNAKDQLNNMLDNANQTLDNLGYAGEDVKNADQMEAVMLPWQTELMMAQDAKDRALSAFPLLFDSFDIDYPGTISSAADVDAAINWLNAQAGSEEQAANALVAEKKAALNAILSSINTTLGRYGYSKTVTGSGDMAAAIRHFNGNPSAAESYVWGRVNEGLMGIISIKKLDDVPAAKSTAKAIYESGLYPDFTTELYNQFLESLDEAVARVEAIPTVKNDLNGTYTTNLKKAEAELKAAEDALAEVGGDIATLISYMRIEQDKVEAAEVQIAEYENKLDAAEAVKDQLETIAPALEGVAQAEDVLNSLYDMLTAAPAMIDQMNEGQAMMETAEAALATLEDYYDQMVTAEENIGLLAQGVEGLEKMESYKTMLDEYLTYLPMLIGVFEDFVDHVGVVSDRFWDDAWVVKKHVKDGADFDMLTAAAESMIGKPLYTNADLKSADELIVATGKTQFNMSMYTVTVVYKASVVNPLLVDSDELYDLIDYQAPVKITMEAGASAEQVMAEILKLKAEEAALESWAAYGVNTTGYTVTETDLPATLNKNLTYVVTFAPKTLNLSYQGMTGPATVLYGHLMSLPLNETEGKEYTYMINGTLQYQGEIVKLTEDATIVRKEADASADRNLLDVVVNATSVSEAVKKILSSSALTYAESIKIRFPSAALLVVDTDDKILTANKYPNAIGNKGWVAQSVVTKDVNGNVLESLNNFINDKIAYGDEFAIADVLYQIAFTAADANTTDAKILEAMNFANVLLDEYNEQKAALDFLAADGFMNALAMLDGNDTTITGYLEMAKAALATDPAKPALDTIIKDLNSSSNGKLTLYNLLFNYKEQGMAYYYKNDAAVRNELAKMQTAMDTLTSSSTFMGLVKSNDQSLHDKLLGIKDSLLATSIPVKNSKIQTANDAALKQLVIDLDAYAQVGKTIYSTVGELKWNTTLSATVGVKVVTINMAYGTQTVTLKLGFAENKVLDADDIQDMLSKLAVLEAELGINTKHFVREGALPKIGDVMNQNLTEEELTYNLVWTAKKYDVVVKGDDVLGSVTFEDPYFTLPTHSDPNFRYDYVINGVTYAQGSTVNFSSNFDALFASGKLVIERKEIDKVREQMINFVDRMKGALTLVEHGNRKYSLVLKVDPATISADMSNFAMGLLMSGYGYIGMDGEMFYGAMTEDGVPQFHLQTMVDMIMNSGMGTQTILDLYGARGFNNIALNGQIISANGGNIKALGGKMLQSTMSFGSTAEDALEVGFYVTVSDSSTVKQLHSAIQATNGFVSIALQNGRVEASVNLPDQAYAAYLAALSMVGETDVHSLEEVNAEIALGYLFSLIDPILGDEGITTDTFENTLAMFGQNADLSAYASTYKKMQTMLNDLLANRTYDKSGCTVSIENFSINAMIDWAQQNVIAKLAAGFGVSADDIKLSTMIYEYKNAGDDDSRDDFGLDLKIYAELANINKNYAALFISPSGSGVSNKINMLTVEEVEAGALANLSGVSYVILLDDVNVNLVTNGTVLIDLNGKTINGSYKSNGTAYLMDNTASVGGITGKLSGNITITDGKFDTDVSAFLPAGYEQKANGTVSNKLFTITSDGNNNITVTIHTNLSSIRELMNVQSAGAMGVNIAMDLLMNHYNMAALSMGPADGELYKVFDVGFADILGLLTGDDLIVNGANTVLGWTSLSDLADLFNAFTDDLTDFGAIADALGGDGVIATYKIETAPWQIGVKHVDDGDYMTFFLTSNEKRTEGSLTLALDGALTEDLKVLYSALDKTVDVDSKVDFDDLQIDKNGYLGLNGSYKGSVEVDFTSDRNYVVTLAVILAHGNSAIRSEMVEAIKAYYASGETSLVDLEESFEALSALEIAKALANHNRSKTFNNMVKDLGLNGIVDSELGNDEMGYAQVIDVLSVAFRALDERNLLERIFGYGRTLGSFEKSDLLGDYYGFSTSGAVDKVVGPFRGYSAGIDFELFELSFKLRLFSEEALVLVTNAAGERIGTFDNLEEAFALANKNPGSTITVTGGVTARNDLLVNTDIKLFGVKRITFANGAQILLNADNAQLTTDKAIDEYVAVSNTDAFCLSVAQDGKHTVYTAKAHFDSATDKDHVCDYGCGKVMEDCYDHDNDGKCDVCGCDLSTECKHIDANDDHFCDLCGEKLSECLDFNDDHFCDICGSKLSDCLDFDEDHFCDICGDRLSDCYDAPNDGDHNCDLCGKKNITDCADKNNDGKCDDCGKYLVLPTLGAPAVKLGDKAFGYQIDNAKKILYLDLNRKGVSVAELEELMAVTMVTYDKDGKVAIKVVDQDNNPLTGQVCTTAKITLIAANDLGKATAEYTIVVIGDVNCNGLIDNSDALLISGYYTGTKALEELMLDAADTNRNGRIENNDAVLNAKKYVVPLTYTSNLTVKKEE